MSVNLPIYKSTNNNSYMNEWNRPSDWPIISDCGDKEIFMVVDDTCTGIAFNTILYGINGTYTIDWGDGTIETDRMSNHIYQHQYAVGSGIPCSEGYTTFKLKIYNATAKITNWGLKRHTYSTRNQEFPLLELWLGANVQLDIAALYINTTPGGYCKKLRAVTIIEPQTSIYSTFENCTGLRYVKLPDVWASSSCNNMFYNCYSLENVTLPASWGSITNASSMFYGCNSLKNVTLPSSWGSVTNVSSMFRECYSLEDITLPISWGSVTNVSSMFMHCNYLKNIILPSSWGSVTNVSSMFYNCYILDNLVLPSSWSSVSNCNNMFTNLRLLRTITLPSSWSAVTSCAAMFQLCTSLQSITLPVSWGAVSSVSSMFNSCYALRYINLPSAFSSLTDVSQMFANCYSLEFINNIEFLGCTVSSTTFTDFMLYVEQFQGTLTIGSLITKFGCYGSYGYPNKVNSIRLTNKSSLFSGTTPHIDVSYTLLSISTMELLFDDLPTGLTNKTINITGTAAAAAAYSRSVVTTSGSSIITTTDTTNQEIGQEVIGTGINTARSVTFQDSGDTVTLAGHGIPNGKRVSFPTITTTTGIIRNTPYYVINATTNTFQVSLTENGSAISLTTNGTGYLMYVPVIISFIANTSITLDVPCSASGSVTATITNLKRSKALLKGWTVTG